MFIKEFVRRLREHEFHEAKDYKMDEPNHWDQFQIALLERLTGTSTFNANLMILSHVLFLWEDLTNLRLA